MPGRRSGSTATIRANAGAYLERQIERAQEKCAAPVEQLAQLSLIEYEQQRKQAAKTLGVRVSQLDRMVGAARERDQKEDVDSKIAEINAEYALVLAGNKAAVMKFEDKTKFRLLQVGAFKQWFANQLIQIGKERHYARRLLAGPPGAAAISGHRVRAAGICSSAPATTICFKVLPSSPRQGDCSKFLAHVKDNAARGDEATYLWIVGWWAQILQQPTIKMETALVLRGPFGAGKTKIGTGDGIADRRSLPAGRVTALHHRPVQLAHGIAAGAARRRGVLGGRQGERRHVAGLGDGRAITCSNTSTSIRSASKTTCGCS